MFVHHLKPRQIYMKKTTKTSTLLLAVCITLSLFSSAQLTLTGQLRTRSEFRDGQGTPLSNGAKPAFFTSQRTRLSLAYATYGLKFGVTAQDVRVWGQDVSTINRTTSQDLNGLMLHEAWAEIQLTDTALKSKTLSLKIGRQELVYDDQRLLGNLDWLQQGRRHDAAVLKYETKNWMLHFGNAFNQNKENASGTVYNSTPAGNYPATTNGGNMYKSLEYFYAGRKLKKGNVSFLFLADQFSRYHNDSVTSLKVFERNTWSRATTGFCFTNSFNKLAASASAYYQLGKTASGQDISAELLSGSLSYSLSKKLTPAIGVDYYSGGSNGTTSHAFDPLYGTPHKFAGLMDYYYAANSFGKNGLIDYYIKGKYKPSGKFLLSLDLHQFQSASSTTNYSSKDLGQEIDLVGNFALTKQIGFEAGYAHYFVTSLLTSPSVKNVSNAKSTADWAYVMINIKPEFLLK
jgi:hypothetical protein